VVSYWERLRLLRPQNPGRRIPACYTVSDLIRLEVVCTLRRDGASLKRVGRALRDLSRLLPLLMTRPGARRLAVAPQGHVVHFEDANTLLELSASAGQLAVFNIADIAREARAAIAWAAAA
jgi:DNA-binding transcriptional MerR regulator